MKIINREDFLKLPEGTLFTKYAPYGFDELEIKGETLKDANDFFYQRIVDAVDANDSNECVDILEISACEGKPFNLDLNCQSRDGLFDDDQQFSVWEKPDITNFIERLQQAIKDGYGGIDG